jgi:hypothetical protein
METVALAPTPHANHLLAPIAEHWLKARVDAPLAAVERLDQNAKQLIALAAALQTALTAVIKLAKVEDPWMLSLAMVSFALLFTSTIFATVVLHRQQGLQVAESVVPMLKTRSSGDVLDELSRQIEAVCRDVDTVLQAKKKALTVALGCFAASMLGSIGCLSVALIQGA